jgi:TonB family protein
MPQANSIHLQMRVPSQKSDSSSRFLVNRSVIAVVIGLIVSLWIPSPAWPNADKDRKAAAKSLAQEIERAQFHKIYVPDFFDPSGVRTEKGCYFASTFSTNLAKSARNFEVVNRIQARKQLDELHISPQDLQQQESLSKAAMALGADAVLVGSANVSPTDARLSLTLRDAASGKEVRSVDYHEQLEFAFEGSFPAAQSDGGRVYFFPGLDGISVPKCISCPYPDYTDEARRNKVQGTVVISVSLNEKGMITDARVLRAPDDGLALQSVNILKKWRLEPARDLDGKAIAARVLIETSFHLYR